METVSFILVVFVRNKASRTYVGEVLDLLKRVNKRYASLEESEDGKGVTHLSLTGYLELGVSPVTKDLIAPT